MRLPLASVTLCALVFVGLPGRAQTPDVYDGVLDPEGRAWRSLDNLLASNDAAASSTRKYLQRLLAMRSWERCQTFTLPGRDEKPPTEVGPSLQQALSDAKHGALATVLSLKAGRRSNFGTLLELQIEENFLAPFQGQTKSQSPAQGKAADRIYYFYPGWKHLFRGVDLCLVDTLVPTTIPAPGDRIVIFTPPYDDNSPPYYFSSTLLPVIFESGQTTKTNLMGDEVTRNGTDIPFDDIVLLLRGMAQLTQQ